jgi:hypothetical protein
MSLTKVDICNAALDTIGATPIAAIADANLRAEACNRNYDLAVKEALRSHAWNFAKDRATLTIGTAPSFEWASSFALPADYVTLLQLNGVSFPAEPGDFFEIEGTNLLTDETTAEIQYIKVPADPSKFDALFVAALTYLLASKIAPALRQDGVGASVNLLQLYDRAVTKAKMRDANEHRAARPDPALESRFVQSRFFRMP